MAKRTHKTTPGKIVRMLREERGLSQSDVTLRMSKAGYHITVPNLSDIERDVKWVERFRAIQALADALGTTPGMLFP